jgi:hypothetical protein
LTLDPLEEIGDRHVQHLGDPPKARSENPVRGALVPLNLLEPHADRDCHLILRQSKCSAAVQQSPPNMFIDGLAHLVLPLVLTTV